MTYNEILPHIEKGENNSAESSCWFRKIVGHEGLRILSNPSYSISWWNGHMECEKEESTIVPLAVIAAEEPVTCDV